jgi:hypothetical protein
MKNKSKNQKSIYFRNSSSKNSFDFIKLIALLLLLFITPIKSLAHDIGTCDTSIEGSFLYDRENKAFIGCDGNQWVLLGEANKKNDRYTKLLLHFDGADESTLFTDSSSSAHTVTNNGNVQIDATRNYFGGASVHFDGAGDYLSINNHADFQLGNDSFTIDGWIYYDESIGDTANRMLLSKDGGTANYNTSTGIEYHLYVSFTGSLIFNWNNGGIADAVRSSVSIKSKQWQHFAIVNDSANDVIKMFLDGKQVGVNEVAVSVSNVATTNLRIGDNGSSNPEWIGNIDEFQISKGIARWSQNFVSPEKPNN